MRTNLLVKKGLIWIIIILCVGTSMIPLADSLSEQHRISTNHSQGPSIQNTRSERTEQPPTPLTGLAPRNTQVPTSTPGGKTEQILPESSLDCYAYNVFDPNYQLDVGPVTFNEDAVVNLLQANPNDFITGTDFDFENNWYGINYNGGLYKINPDNGDMTLIAGTIPWCTSLVIDRTTSTWYVSDPYALYTINIETGETTLVGPFEITNYIISLMSDNNGNMYGYDVVDQGNSTLYHINTSTGFASPIGDMGHTFCYAQEGKFDRLGNTLYLAAYDIGTWSSYLATCDPATGHVTIINEFSPSDIEIDALTIPWNWLIPGIGVNEIIAPMSGNAHIITPEVTIQNHGWYDIANVPVNMTIVKNQYTEHMNEHFNESLFPPPGWSNLGTTDYWVQSNTTNAGGTAPEAVLWDYHNYGGTGGLQSAYVDTSSATSLTLTFRSYIAWSGGPCNCTIEATSDGGTTWHDISPWINPLLTYQLPWQFTINISAYRGTQTGIRFTYSGQYTWMSFWAIDDVRMYTRDKIPEYNQTIYTDVPAWTTMDIVFPDWTPSDLGVSTNVTIEYVASATTRFSGNYFPYNYKYKIFTLHFKSFLDQRPYVRDISGPSVGLIGVECHFSTVVVDPDGDAVSCVWDWGDGTTSDWQGPYANGATIDASHTWSTEGAYEIRVKPRDQYGLEGNWSTPFVITIHQALTKTFIFGKYSNMTNQGNYVTVTAVNIRMVSFHPFQVIHAVAGEMITYSKNDLRAVILPHRIFGIVYVLF